MTHLSDEVVDHLAAALDEPDLEGTKYRLVRSLGRGGMGSVFEAEDVELGRRVALKVSSIARREASIVARLEHPGIVPVHDVGRLPDGRIFYAMKLVQGTTLDEWAKNASLSAILRMFQRVCEAVAFAHSHGVVHRDLKPANVMIGAFGEALVMDWGVARDLAAVDDAREIAGTPTFMAPEQKSGSGSVDARTDVFGLGATLRHVLPQEQDAAVLAIVAKATAEKADDRYASARELAEDIGRRLDGERVHAHTETLPERIQRIASRHRVVLALLGVYVLVRVALAIAAR